MEQVNNARTTMAVAAIGTVAVLVFALLPPISGALAEKFLLDNLQTGLAATSYFAAYAVITVTSSLWVRRFRWRSLLLLGFTAMIIGLLACLFASSFSVVQYSLAIVGAGAGLLFPISFTIASDMQNTDRIFAIKLAAEQLVPAAILMLLTTVLLIISAYQSLFLGILLVVILGSTSILLVPDNLQQLEIEKEEREAKVSRLLSVLALGGLSINFAGFAGVWAFLERIANESSLDPAFTGRWIAIGLLTSGLGPLIVAFVGDRLDRRIAIVAATGITVLCLLFLRGEIVAFYYSATLVLLPFTFYFSLSYMLAVVAEVDYNGKISSLMSFVLAIGAIAGPALFGYLKSTSGPVLGAMAALILVGAGMMVVVLMLISNSQKPMEQFDG